MLALLGRAVIAAKKPGGHTHLLDFKALARPAAGVLVFVRGGSGPGPSGGGAGILDGLLSVSHGGK